MGRQMGEKKGMRGRINHDRINQRGAGGSLGVGGEGDFAGGCAAGLLVCGGLGRGWALWAFRFPSRLS